MEKSWTLLPNVPRIRVKVFFKKGKLVKSVLNWYSIVAWHFNNSVLLSYITVIVL
jgi:hypothetical protein